MKRIGIAALGLALAVLAAPGARAQGPARKAGDSFQDCADACPAMVVIPAGSFLMGSPAAESGRSDNESPQHRVTIAAPFAVGKYDVTRGEFARFVADTHYDARGDGCTGLAAAGKFEKHADYDWQNASFPQTDRDPVVCVDWDDAQAYVSWLGRKTGHNYRLLSEAEWEYAERAGTATPYWWGNNADDACSYANTADQTAKAKFPAWPTANCNDHYLFTSPVGSFRPNAFGLYDMSGDVWQWLGDCFHPNYDGAPADGAAWTRGDCTIRLRRGGSWDRDPPLTRAAARGKIIASDRGSGGGFRVARGL